MCVLSRTDNSLFEMDGVTLWSQFKRLFKRKKKDQFRLDYVIKVLSLLALSLSPHFLSLSINQICQGAASLLFVRVVNTRPLSLALSHSLLSLSHSLPPSFPCPLPPSFLRPVSKVLLDKGGDVNFVWEERGEDGMAMIHRACAVGAFPFVRWLMNKGRHG